MSNIYWLLNRSIPIALNIELSEAVLNERDRSIESSMYCSMESNIGSNMT